MAHSGPRYPAPGGYPYYPQNAWTPVEHERTPPRGRGQSPVRPHLRPPPPSRPGYVQLQPDMSRSPQTDKHSEGDVTTDMQRSLLALAGSLMAQYMIKQEGKSNPRQKPPSLMNMPLRPPGPGASMPAQPPRPVRGVGRGSALNFAGPGLGGNVHPRASYSNFAGKTPGQVKHTQPGLYEHDYYDYGHDYAPQQQWQANYPQTLGPQFEGSYASTDYNLSQSGMGQQNVQRKQQLRGKAGWPMKTQQQSADEKRNGAKEYKSREKTMTEEWNQGIQQLMREATELAALAIREEQGQPRSQQARKPKAAYQPKTQQKHKGREGLPFTCELCNVQSHSAEQLSMHFNGKKHAQRYLAKQNELGFEEFDRWYKGIPYPRKMEEGMTFVPRNVWDCAGTDPTTQWTRFIEYVLRSGQLNNLICTVCLTECMTMSNWWAHLMGQKHMKKCTELAETIGWAKYNLEYGDIPVIDPSSISGTGQGDWTGHHGLPPRDPRTGPPANRYGRNPAGPGPSEHMQVMGALHNLLPHVDDRHITRAVSDLQHGVNAAPADYAVAMQVQQMSYANLHQTAQVVHILRSLDPSLVHELTQTNPALLQGMFAGLATQQPRQPPRKYVPQPQGRKKQQQQQQHQHKQEIKQQKPKKPNQASPSKSKSTDDKVATPDDKQGNKKNTRGKKGGKKHKQQKSKEPAGTSGDTDSNGATEEKEGKDEETTEEKEDTGTEVPKEKEEGLNDDASASEENKDSSSEEENGTDPEGEDKTTEESKDSETVPTETVAKETT